MPVKYYSISVHTCTWQMKKAWRRMNKKKLTYVFYLVVVKVTQFALSTDIPPSDVQGWLNISLGPCPSSIPCALESTVVEWDRTPPMPLLCSSLRWHSLDVSPFKLLLMLSLVVLAGEDFEVEPGVFGLLVRRRRWLLSILVIRLSSGPNGRSSKQGNVIKNYILKNSFN